ncbi:hypothetical protein DMUE_5163, partial [Dictyocoela muelleri]
MIDTGATYNFINEHILPDNATEIEKVDEINIELVDGRHISTDRMIKFYMTLQGDTQTKYLIQAYVIKPMNIDLIVGIEFLTKNEANINLKDLTISLDDKVYEFEQSIRIAYPDVELQNKTRIAMSM